MKSNQPQPEPAPDKILEAAKKVGDLAEMQVHPAMGAVLIQGEHYLKFYYHSTQLFENAVKKMAPDVHAAIDVQRALWLAANKPRAPFDAEAN
jgi:hypothetical protein